MFLLFYAVYLLCFCSSSLCFSFCCVFALFVFDFFSLCNHAQPARGPTLPFLSSSKKSADVERVKLTLNMMWDNVPWDMLAAVMAGVIILTTITGNVMVGTI